MDNSQIELIKTHLELKNKYEQAKSELKKRMRMLEKELNVKQCEKEYKDSLEGLVQLLKGDNLGNYLNMEDLWNKKEMLELYGDYDKDCIHINFKSNLIKYDYVNIYIHIKLNCIDIFKEFYKEGSEDDWLRVELYKIILNKEYEKEISKTTEDINNVVLNSEMIINGTVVKCLKYNDFEEYYMIDNDIDNLDNINTSLYNSVEEIKKELLDYYNKGKIKTFILTS